MGLSSQLAPSAIAKPGVCTSTTKPASPYEGQVIYTTDLDTLEIWNGTAWRILGLGTPSTGSVLQIVQGSTTTGASSSTTTYADTNLSASITPTSTSSKVLVIFAQQGLRKTNGNANNAIRLQLVRGSTSIHVANNALLFTGTALENRGSCTGVYLDSPATTSATTYKTQFANDVAAAAVEVQSGGVNSVSTITLMEVAG